ncbi:MAG TPA: LysR family transcriptional regulator [Ktedonobacteraceae bacterium]|nr:LysR family transcriptional regulator [Ktedonobacteraceae bacterium]
MDIDQLQAYERIVRDGSFSRAARALNITQPTISARIQALEQEVGGKLFTRAGRKVALTERGESFLPYARRALEVLAEGVEAAQLTQEGKRGRVTVGTIESLAGGFLASSIASFHDTHPKVDFFVRTGHSDQVVEMLYDGVVKLGLISWPLFNPDLIPLLHFREPLILVAPAGSSLIGRGTVTLTEAQRAKGHLLKVQWQWGPPVNITLLRITEQMSPMVELPFETVRHLLLDGIGAAFLTRALVAEDLKSGRLVEVEVADLPPAYRESALVYLAHRGPLNAVLADFVEVMREEAGELCY